jgi:phosphoglycerate dehydrogenase-like enzyme
MSKPTIIITETLDKVCADWLSERAHVIWHMHDQPGVEDVLAQCDGAVVRTYTQVNDAWLDMAPNLKVVGRAGVGLDNFDLPICQQRGVRVVFTPDANTQAVVEYVYGLILDHYRPRTAMPTCVGDKEFHGLRKTQVGLQINELTLGILGFGRIGKRIGQVAAAFGMKVLVNDLIDEFVLHDAVNYDFKFVDKATLYSQSDILTVHTDGRKDNHHLLNSEAFNLLKPDCLFINAARGMLVSDADLAAWITANEQAHAILDVHDPEPPQADNPLWPLTARVKMLPHLASRTDSALQNMSWVVKDVMAVLEGVEPQYPAF